MYLIDQTYFIKELSIPNLNEMDSDTLTTLNIDIDKYVRLVLQNALGYELFKDLDSNITSGVLDSGADQKWKDLVNGVEYTKDGKTYRWKGLIFTEGNYKGSLLAKYVYYYWLKDSISLLTGTGEKTITASNMEAVNSNQRLVSVWNDFVMDYQSTPCYYGNGNLFIYNGVPVNDWFGGIDAHFVSLIQFLTDKDADYPNSAKMLYNNQNQLGL